MKTKNAQVGSMCATCYWFFKIFSGSDIPWKHCSSSFSFCWIPWNKVAAFATSVIFFCLSTARVSWIKPFYKALSELANKVFCFFLCLPILQHHSPVLVLSYQLLSCVFCFFKSALYFVCANLQLFLSVDEIVNVCIYVCHWNKLKCHESAAVRWVISFCKFFCRISLFTEKPLSIFLWPCDKTEMILQI